MASIDMNRVIRRARLKYEWARARQAFWAFAPALLLVLCAALLSRRPTSAAIFGACLFVVGVALLWYGRDLKRAVLPGLVAGLVPLILALCANHMGHVCTGESCTSWCMPACTAGGLGAGLALAGISYRERHGPSYWVAVSLMTLLTGAMGCTCIGYSGVAGLGLGYSVGLFGALARRLAR